MHCVLTYLHTKKQSWSTIAQYGQKSNFHTVAWLIRAKVDSELEIQQSFEDDLKLKSREKNFVLEEVSIYSLRWFGECARRIQRCSREDLSGGRFRIRFLAPKIALWLEGVLLTGQWCQRATGTCSITCCIIPPVWLDGFIFRLVCQGFEVLGV